METIERYKGKYTGAEIDELLGRIPLIQAGTTGGGGDKTEEIVISNSSDTWEIEHSLDKFPSVTIVEYYSGEEIVGDVQYESKSKIIIRFTESLKGKVYLN